MESKTLINIDPCLDLHIVAFDFDSGHTSGGAHAGHQHLVEEGHF
jgi:hypothetical protein